MLGQVESCLEKLGLKGISISRVKGHGEYENFYSSDHGSMLQNERFIKSTSQGLLNA